MNKHFSIIKNVVKKTFSFSGRASRKEFIVFNVFYLLLVIIILNTEKYLTDTDSLFLVIFSTSFYCFSFLITTPPIFALIARRMHDLNFSGWWPLIMFFPFGQLLFFVLFFKAGTPTINKYGEPPTY